MMPVTPLADAKVQTPAAPTPLAPEAAPAPAPQAPAAPAVELPEPIASVARRELPGVIVPPLRPGTQPDPLQLFVVSNLDVIMEAAPIQYYDTAAQETVLYNSELLTEEQLQQAEQDGTLQKLVQPAAAASQNAPAGSAEGTSLPAPSPAVPAQKAPAPGAGVQDILANARVKNVTGGPKVSPIQPNPVGQQLARRTV